MDLTIRLLRRARLLGRLATQLHDMDLVAGLPAVVVDQLVSARVTVEARQRAALWEVDRLAWGLRELPDVPLVLMKGCAYALAGTPNAQGRSFADVDVMVPERDLPTVEAALRARGWVSKELSPYDDQYYRRWAHELPPMTHVERDVEVDLHHNILMRTARLKPSAELLLADARPVAGSRFKVLSPVDMVLHAMVHLFAGGEIHESLRELVDIDDLLRHFGAAEPGFWEHFWPRANELGLGKTAYYGLRYARSLLGTPVPGFVVEAARNGEPLAVVRWGMDALVPPAILPADPDCNALATSVRAGLLYVRSHWIRMPVPLLVWHLARKSFRRIADGR